ncbi:hypothetical protein H0H93_015684 [Arthromyces matolae]|nr:hypothetical protein H0H93_015684 [Arthromyces matolae]
MDPFESQSGTSFSTHDSNMIPEKGGHQAVVIRVDELKKTIETTPGSQLDNSDLVVTARVFFIIAEAKLIVSAFESKSRLAIMDIKACEAAAVARQLKRQRPWTTAEEIKKSIQKLEVQLEPAEPLSRDTEIHTLTTLVTGISYLLLAEPRKIRDELELGYQSLSTKIHRWKDVELKTSAEEQLKKWKGLNSLVRESGTCLYQLCKLVRGRS